ncbi:hypothetical protein [Fusobacterium periodonticum]|nr:hypothetical protein [Fusobacterium periodonticum]
MKKILLALLVIFAIILYTHSGVKYEFRDNILYGDGKEASGTFEFKISGFKTKGEFVNGLPNGVFERYYPDGSIMMKYNFVDATSLSNELYYKSGQLMGTLSKDDILKLYYDDGQLIMVSNQRTGEYTIYHENGKPLMNASDEIKDIYNEKHEILFNKKLKNNGAGAILKELGDGSSVLIKNKKIIANIDVNGAITYLYSTGEPLIRLNDELLNIFFKDGNILFESDGNNFTLNYKDGKPLYEDKRSSWKFFSNDGKEISSNFEKITNIKRID